MSSVEVKKGKEPLSRMVELSIAHQSVEERVNNELKKESKTASLKGYRPGKVPFQVLKKYYGPQARQRALQDLINDHFIQVVEDKKLELVSHPQFELIEDKPGQDIKFSANFEVYPQIKLKGIDKLKVQQPVSEVTEQDEKDMINSLAQQQVKWTEVKRKSKLKDQLDINFEGFIDDKPFDRGSAEGFTIELGSNQMIPGFEEGLVGFSAGEETELNLRFPKEYHEESLKDKPVKFKVKVNAVKQPELPKIDDAFAKTFRVDSLKALKDEVRKNMQRQLDENIRMDVKNQVIDQLVKENKIDIPSALLAQEIHSMKHQAFAQMGRKPSADDLKNIPDDAFKEEAAKRIQVGLMLRAYVQDQKLKLEDKMLNMVVEEMASLYEDPKGAIVEIKSNKEQMSQISEMAMERQIMNHLLAQAEVKDKKVKFSDMVKNNR